MRKEYFPTTDQKVLGLNPNAVTKRSVKAGLLFLCF
jgi:hypothetical protein